MEEPNGISKLVYADYVITHRDSNSIEFDRTYADQFLFARPEDMVGDWEVVDLRSYRKGVIDVNHKKYLEIFITRAGLPVFVTISQLEAGDKLVNSESRWFRNWLHPHDEITFWEVAQ